MRLASSDAGRFSFPLEKGLTLPTRDKVPGDGESRVASSIGDVMDQHAYERASEEFDWCECGEPLYSECHREWMNAQNKASEIGSYRRWDRTKIVDGKSYWSSSPR